MFVGKHVMRFIGCFSIVLSMYFLGCNTAPDGFNAPSDSTVTVLAEGTSIVTGVPVLRLVNVQVEVVENNENVPGGNIFVQIQCVKCTIYDKADGEAFTAADASKLQEVSNPYAVITDSRGIYPVVVEFQPSSSLGVSSYTAEVLVDIGVATGNATFTINDPDNEDA